MAPENHQPHACDAQLARAFDVLGKRWSGMILGSLAAGPGTFTELARALAPIADSMLSDRLSELAGAGLVTRSVRDGRPPNVSYALTDAGAAIVPVLDQLASWAAEHLPPNRTPC